MGFLITVSRNFSRLLCQAYNFLPLSVITVVFPNGEDPQPASCLTRTSEFSWRTRTSLVFPEIADSNQKFVDVWFEHIALFPFQVLLSKFLSWSAPRWIDPMLSRHMRKSRYSLGIMVYDFFSSKSESGSKLVQARSPEEWCSIPITPHVASRRIYSLSINWIMMDADDLPSAK